MSRNLRVRQIPNSEELKRFDVTQKGMRDVVRQPLYDTQVYPAVGATSISFFQQGIAGRTADQTNMVGNGQLTDPNEFLVETISLRFYPNSTILNFNTGAAFPDSYINDVQAFERGGNLMFKTLEKVRVQLAPMGAFPDSTRLVADAAVATTIADPYAASFQNASLGGQVFRVEPEVRLMPNQNFIVTLSWATPIALPSNKAAIVQCKLGGLLYRAVQ